MKAPDTPDDEQARLAMLRSYDVLDTEAEQVFDDLVQLAGHICGVPISLVSLVDTNRQWFKARLGLDAQETPRAISFCGHAILERSTLVIPDTRQDARFRDNPLVTGPPDIRFYAGAPLRTPSGHSVGTLCVIDTRPREFDAEAQSLLERLARQVVSQLELRKRNAELELTELERAAQMKLLSASEQRFRALTHSAPFPILRLDHAGACEYVNPAWTDLTGLDPEGSSGEGWIEALHGPDRQETAARWRAVEGSLQQFVDELVVRSTAGDLRTVHAVASFVDGGLVAAMMDVSERRAAERAKDELVSVVSHELRTPLTSIRGALGLIDAGSLGEVPESMAPLLQAASQSAVYLSRLVDDLLDMDRIGSGNVVLDLAPMQTGETLAQLREQVAGMLEAQAVTLRIDAEADYLFVADPLRLSQALLNLLGNAIKFSPSGGTVDMRATRRDGQIVFEVADEGPGIAEVDRERIFQRFERLDPSTTRATPGTGLGLSITKSIAQLHRGAVGVRGRPGPGSVFWLSIPA